MQLGLAGEPGVCLVKSVMTLVCFSSFLECFVEKEGARQAAEQSLGRIWYGGAHGSCFRSAWLEAGI